MIKAKLFVLGTQRELLSTDLEYYRTRNTITGRPGPIPMGGLVTLAFTSGYGDDRLLYALLHSPEGELCTLTTAKIVFYAGDPDGVVLFEYRLKDAAFIYWKEEFNAAGEAPMTVTLTISAAIQEIKGVTWVKPWRESEVPSEESVVRKEGAQREVLGDRGKKENNGGVLEGGILEDVTKGNGVRSINDFIPSSGTQLIGNPNKATTLLGRWNPDMQAIHGKMLPDELNVGTELGSVTTNNGGFNFLAIEDNLANASNDFFNQYNKPWLQSAMQRGDDIILVTNPVNVNDFIDPITGDLLGMYAKELELLVQQNYKPINLSDIEWSMVKSWFL